MQMFMLLPHDYEKFTKCRLQVLKKVIGHMATFLYRPIIKGIKADSRAISSTVFFIDFSIILIKLNSPEVIKTTQKNIPLLRDLEPTAADNRLAETKGSS
jgi:hypothetical protein